MTSSQVVAEGVDGEASHEVPLKRGLWFLGLVEQELSLLADVSLVIQDVAIVSITDREMFKAPAYWLLWLTHLDLRTSSVGCHGLVQAEINRRVSHSTKAAVDVRRDGTYFSHGIKVLGLPLVTTSLLVVPASVVSWLRAVPQVCPNLGEALPREGVFDRPGTKIAARTPVVVDLWLHVVSHEYEHTAERVNFPKGEGTKLWL